MSNRLREAYDSTREEAARNYRRAGEAVTSNPGTSVLVGFGIGFGVGLVLTSLLTRREETWADRYLPDSLRDLPDSVRNFRIPDRVSDAAHQVSDPLHHSFRHLSESIRELPSAIAKLIPHR